jgi:hypothetical protein
LKRASAPTPLRRLMRMPSRMWLWAPHSRVRRHERPEMNHPAAECGGSVSRDTLSFFLHRFVGALEKLFDPAPKPPVTLSPFDVFSTHDFCAPKNRALNVIMRCLPGEIPPRRRLRRSPVSNPWTRSALPMMRRSLRLQSAADWRGQAGRLATDLRATSRIFCPSAGSTSATKQSGFGGIGLTPCSLPRSGRRGWRICAAMPSGAGIWMRRS